MSCSALVCGAVLWYVAEPLHSLARARWKTLNLRPSGGWMPMFPATVAKRF